jgi:hypothetical protein
MKPTVIVAAVVVGLFALVATQLAHAADAKAKYTIKQVMKATQKGDDAIGKRVAKGQGTKEDFAKLVEYFESLPLCTPEKGDQASWNAKAMALVKSARALKAGEPNALAAYKQAANCKACHSVHKPD